MSVLSEILAKITGIDNSKKRIRTKLNGLSAYGDSTPLVDSDATLDECADAVESIRSLEELQYERSSGTSSGRYMLNLFSDQGGGVYAYTGYVKNPYVYIPVSELQLIPVYGQSNPEVHLTGTEGYVTEDKLNDVSVEIPLQSKSVSPSTGSQSVYPDIGYFGLSSVTVEAMPTATQATPSISVSSTGLITASAEQSAGYVSAGTKSATMQLQTRGARVITPGKDSITILAGNYLTGNQTIIGSDDLIPENIRKGVTIFGVVGTYEPATGPYSILESTTSFTKLNAWTIRLTLNSQGIADGVFKSGVKYQLVIDGVSKGTVTGNGSGSIYFATGMFTLTYNGSYIDMDLGTDISPTSIDIIANVA